MGLVSWKQIPSRETELPRGLEEESTSHSLPSGLRIGSEVTLSALTVTWFIRRVGHVMHTKKDQEQLRNNKQELHVGSAGLA